MKHFVYTSFKTGKVVFECDALGIIEADKMLLAATGIVADKDASIGCTVGAV